MTFSGKTLLVLLVVMLLNVTAALADEKADKQAVETYDDTSSRKSAQEYDKEGPNPPHRANFATANQYMNQGQFQREFFIRGNDRNMRKPLEDTYRLDRHYEKKMRLRFAPGFRR